MWSVWRTIAGMLIGLPLAVIPIAMEQDTNPWPPDQEEIFVEGVDVVISETITDRPGVLPKADDQERLVRVFDAKTDGWRKYPYPDGVATLSHDGRVRSNGTIVFYSTSAEKQQLEWWVLDPSRGVFFRGNICGDHLKALPGEGEWVFYHPQDEEQTFICFTESGRLSGRLPEGIGWDGGIPSASPDGAWVALLGTIYRTNDSVYPAVVVYAYNLEAESTIYLGPIGHVNYYDVGFGQWVSNTRGTIYAFTGFESSGTALYTFDVAQPDVPELAATGWRFSYYDDAPRIEHTLTLALAQYKAGSWVSGRIPCEFTVVDGSGVHRYDLGFDCIYARVTPAGSDYVFVQVDSNPSPTSSLMRLDPATGKLTELLNGEIEMLVGMSPDGRYALLVLDTSGQVDLVDVYFDSVIWERVSGGYLAILDMSSQNIVYQAMTAPIYGSSIEWVDNSTLLLNLADYDWRTRTFDGTAHLLMFEDGRVIHHQAGNDIAHVGNLSPSKRFAIATRDYLDAYYIVDFSNGQNIPFMSQRASNPYDLSFHWISDDRLEIVLQHRKGNYPYYDPRTVTYSLRVPIAEDEMR